MRPWDLYHETEISEIESQTALAPPEGGYTPLYVFLTNAERSPQPFEESKWNISIDTQDTIPDRQSGSAYVREWFQGYETARREIDSQTALTPQESTFAHFHGHLTNAEQHSRSLEELKWLIFCKKLIEHIPSEGLDDLVKTLVDIYSFYQLTRQETQELPSPDRRKKAVFRGRVESPPIVIEFDGV